MSLSTSPKKGDRKQTILLQTRTLLKQSPQHSNKLKESPLRTKSLKLNSNPENSPSRSNQNSKVKPFEGIIKL
jgi:hypothetical protein